MRAREREEERGRREGGREGEGERVQTLRLFVRGVWDGMGVVLRIGSTSCIAGETRRVPTTPHRLTAHDHLLCDLSAPIPILVPIPIPLSTPLRSRSIPCSNSLRSCSSLSPDPLPNVGSASAGPEAVRWAVALPFALPLLSAMRAHADPSRAFGPNPYSAAVGLPRPSSSAPFVSAARCDRSA